MKASRLGWLAWLVSTWATAGLLLAFFDRWLAEALWILLVFVWSAYALAGVVLLALLIVAVVRARRDWARVAMAFAVAIVAFGAALWLAAPHIAGAGDEWLFQRRFSRMRPEYERIVKQLAAVSTSKQRPSSGESHGVQYDVDWGPPVRVLFPQLSVGIGDWQHP